MRHRFIRARPGDTVIVHAGAFEGTGVIFVDGVDAGSAVRWTLSP
jgi:hypothetical protein